MKVKELIAQLLKVNGELLIVMAKDEEGNAFSPLHEIESAVYVPTNTWSGEIYDPDDPDISDEEADKAEQSIVLWPVN